MNELIEVCHSNNDRTLKNLPHISLGSMHMSTSAQLILRNRTAKSRRFSIIQGQTQLSIDTRNFVKKFHNR
jgi:hypothetical protein